MPGEPELEGAELDTTPFEWIEKVNLHYGLVSYSIARYGEIYGAHVNVFYPAGDFSFYESFTPDAAILQARTEALNLLDRAIDCIRGPIEWPKPVESILYFNSVDALAGIKVRVRDVVGAPRFVPVIITPSAVLTLEPEYNLGLARLAAREALRTLLLIAREDLRTQLAKPEERVNAVRTIKPESQEEELPPF